MSKSFKPFKEFISYLMIAIGALMAAFSVACILLPNDAIDYGTAGVAIIISKMTGWPLSPCVFLARGNSDESRLLFFVIIKNRF